MRDQDYRRFISLLKFVYGGVSDNFFLKFKAVNLDRDLDRIPKRENVVRPILKELQGTLEVLNNPSLYLPKLASSEAKADFFSLVFSLSYCFSELLALAERARNEYAARLNLSFAILPDVQTLKTGLQTSCGINFSDRAMPGSKGKNF
ncbi:MAG: hypothetical protein HY939_04750, partial [Gammaproteobacteria bacterium]|nr:hypothetical protein [Gammaproteobacteria bacterium]